VQLEASRGLSIETSVLGSLILPSRSVVLRGRHQGCSKKDIPVTLKEVFKTKCIQPRTAQYCEYSYSGSL
jgi:hypothetical protein